MRELLLVAVAACSTAAADDAVLGEYLTRQTLREATIGSAVSAIGTPVANWTAQDYATFMEDIDFTTDDDVWTWSHVTGIPIVAVRRRCEFFRSNAHMLEGAATDISLLRSSYDSATRQLTIVDNGGESLPLREIGVDPIRVLSTTAQIKHNEGFDEDRTVLEALGPHLAPFGALGYRAELDAALHAWPLSLVRVMRGKALYLSTRRGGGTHALWHDLSSDKSPDFAGLQPGVFLEAPQGDDIAEALARGVGRLVRETVMEGRYFGLYAHPLQFPEFQKLADERRRLFGRRRDRTSIDPTEDFVDHFAAFVTGREPRSADAYEFIRTLVERTPTTTERLSPSSIGSWDPDRQRAILMEYLGRQAQRDAVVAEVQREFGMPFSDFGEREYRRLMSDLDLNRDEDLWTWSHVTGIPIVGLNQRSNYFHMNAHILDDVRAANLMSWAELTALRSTFDRKSGRLRIVASDGRELAVRDLPPDLVQRTATTAGVRHNADFADDRIVFEALEPALLRLSDLENRAELVEGIRLLPLSIVKAHRGKAFYPTDRAKTGWAVTWRIGNDRTVSYVGMQPGNFIEARRDPARANVAPEALVREGLSSLRGSSADSLLHEVGHIIDHAVMGGRPGTASFPHQFPEIQSLLADKERVFGEGDAKVAQTDHGYVSDYAKTNAQENFAEHFWAYLRDRDAFRSRAEQQRDRGHAELMDKFLFLERLIERTPASMQRLSSHFIEARDLERRAEHARRRQRVLDDYTARFAERDAAVAELRDEWGKPFVEFDNDEYAALMGRLDLELDDDLWTWSHATGITILGLTEKSNFFYCNAHLIEDTHAAVTMSGTDLVALKRGYDAERQVPTLTWADGRPLRLRELPTGTVRPVGRKGPLTYSAGFVEPRTVLEAVGPYLATFEEVGDREAIAAGLRALPLAAVKAFRAKAIYLTTQPGRSYAVGMPVSNATYTTFAGMQSGFFLDRGALTTHNLVHELGHVIDYTAIAGRYGSFLHPYQFPGLRGLQPDKERVFGRGDDPVPQTEHGYVSTYARSNAQECFAEHFAAFVLDRERFREMAERQAADGHAELMEKYRFVETLVEKTPVRGVPLSREYLETL